MTAPNIILFIADDMAFEQIARMPQLFTKLSSTGVLFTNAFVAQALCQPARATFLSGQYSHNHGIVRNGTAYTTADHSLLLPARLQAAGYQTSHIGKFWNTYVISDAIPSGWNDWHAMVPTYYSYSVNDNGVVTSKGTAAADYNTTVVSSKAVTAVGSLTQPFFLQIGFKPPHSDGSPLTAIPHPDYSGAISTSKTAPRNINFNASVTGKPDYISSLSELSASSIDGIDAFWRGQTEMVFSMDRAIQAIVEALVTAGRTNTVMIFVSDNGYMHGEHRIPNQKIVPYEESIHIPLIISGPSTYVAQDKVCNHIVSHVDIAATIYELAGATSSLTVDGVSLASLMAEPHGEPVRSSLLVEWLGTGEDNTPIYRCLRGRQYKYTEYETDEVELYDMVSDPFELDNRAGESALSDVQSEMAETLSLLSTCTGEGCTI